MEMSSKKCCFFLNNYEDKLSSTEEYCCSFSNCSSVPSFLQPIHSHKHVHCKLLLLHLYIFGMHLVRKSSGVLEKFGKSDI